MQITINIDGKNLKKALSAKWPVIVVLLALVGIVSVAAVVNKPHSDFTANSVISSGAMNDNFNTIYNAVNVNITNINAVSNTMSVEIATLKTQVSNLLVLLASVTADETNIYFTGVNVRSGAGTTDGAVNGVGNLIVGYNESSGDDHSGSHNLIVGINHSYSFYGGFVAGYDNTINGVYATVSGGEGNTVNANFSSVSAGRINIANGIWSSVRVDNIT